MRLPASPASTPARWSSKTASSVRARRQSSGSCARPNSSDGMSSPVVKARHSAAAMKISPHTPSPQWSTEASSSAKCMAASGRPAKTAAQISERIVAPMPSAKQLSSQPETGGFTPCRKLRIAMLYSSHPAGMWRRQRSPKAAASRSSPRSRSPVSQINCISRSSFGTSWRSRIDSGVRFGR